MVIYQHVRTFGNLTLIGLHTIDLNYVSWNMIQFSKQAKRLVFADTHLLVCLFDDHKVTVYFNLFVINMYINYISYGSYYMARQEQVTWQHQVTN